LEIKRPYVIVVLMRFKGIGFAPGVGRIGAITASTVIGAQFNSALALQQNVVAHSQPDSLIWVCRGNSWNRSR
jgi:hypothetical protein